MALTVAYPGCVLIPAIDSANSLSWSPVCHIRYSRDAWVQLFQRPSFYAENEAKLLCQESADTWVVWVPNHGEVVVDRSQFYCSGVYPQ